MYHEGRPVVDLWGGVADERTKEPWERDTIVLVFSTTKGATAICAHMLVQRGQLELDAPVARYWPEYGHDGKAQTQVRWLLSHQAGQPGIAEPLTLEQACEWEPVIRALERMKPLWEPGTRQAYHTLTYGFLVGEVVRRVSGKSLGRFFAEEVAGPLGLDSWIGLPEELEPRVARLIPRAQPPDLDAAIDLMLAQVPDSVLVPAGAKEALMAMWTNPSSVGLPDALGGAFPPELVTEDGGHNARIVRASEHPGSGMVTDARSLARMYAACVGEVDGVRLVAADTVEEMCAIQEAPPFGVPPELEGFMIDAFPQAMSLGFARPTPSMPLLGSRSFGHDGAGGSLAFGDPEANIGFAYAMNRMADSTETANRLVAAVADCIT